MSDVPILPNLPGQSSENKFEKEKRLLNDRRHIRQSSALVSIPTCHTEGQDLIRPRGDCFVLSDRFEQEKLEEKHA